VSRRDDLVRVLIATTLGPVAICRLTPEPPTLPVSLVTHGARRTTSAIWHHYDGYVQAMRRLQPDLMPSLRYHLTLAEEVQHGESWQLGVAIAHALLVRGRLAREGERAGRTLLCSGTVNSLNGAISPIEHLRQKMEHLPAAFAAAGTGPLSIVLPDATPRREVSRLRETTAADVVLVGTLGQALERLQLGGSAVEPTEGQIGQGQRAGSLIALTLLGGVAAAGLTVTMVRKDAEQAETSPRHAVPAPARPPFRDCAACPEMVALPAGRYLRGSPVEDPDHEASELPQAVVRIGYNLAIGRFEVTVAQFDAFVRATGHVPASRCLISVPADPARWEWKVADFRAPGYPVTPEHPASCVTYPDAVAYAQWLARLTGRPYRLPTEAEWEYAARAGSQTRYAFGDVGPLCHFAKHADAGTALPWRNAGCLPRHAGSGSAAVGSYPPNAWGLHDLHGNVWEWTSDCWAPSHAGGPLDGSSRRREGCSARPTRGGSWWNPPLVLRTARRNRRGEDRASYHVGFRVAVSLDR
jgi:formylglycine-generating enzyme required for sulfatase activity